MQVAESSPLIVSVPARYEVRQLQDLLADLGRYRIPQPLALRRSGLVPCPINSGRNADGSWRRGRGVSRDVMFIHHEWRVTKRSPPTPIDPKGSGPTGSSSLSLLTHNESALPRSSLLKSDPVPPGRRGSVNFMLPIYGTGH